MPTLFDDMSGRAAKPWTLRRRGAALSVVAVLICLVSTLYVRGVLFSETTTLVIEAESVSDGLAAGAPVKLRGLEVGRVAELTTTGPGRQRLVLLIDRRQAAAISDDVVARFSQSNVLGSVAVELVSAGGGSPVRDGAVLHIGANTERVSVTGLLRQGGRVTGVLNSPNAKRVIELLAANVKVVGPMIDVLLGLADIVARNQLGTASHYLGQAERSLAGMADLTPVALTQFERVLDGIRWHSEHGPEIVESVTGTVDNGFKVLGSMFGDNQNELVSFLSMATDLLVPVAASWGAKVSAYERLPAMLDNIDTAFPSIDGKVQLQVELILQQMPQVTNGLSAEPQAGGGNGEH